MVRGEQLDEAVWAEVCTLLRDPYRLEQEYRRRLEGPDGEVQATMLAELIPILLKFYYNHLMSTMSDLASYESSIKYFYYRNG